MRCGLLQRHPRGAYARASPISISFPLEVPTALFSVHFSTNLSVIPRGYDMLDRLLRFAELQNPMRIPAESDHRSCAIPITIPV